MSILAGYMVPHPPLAVHEVGRGDEEKIRASLASYEEVAKDIAALRPDTIIVTSPHTVMYSDYFHIAPGKWAEGNFSQFRAPKVSFRVRYDTELRDEICRRCEEADFPAGTAGERDRALDHGIMVPLYFIEKEYQDFRLLRIGLSGYPLSDHYRLGRIIRDAVEDLDIRAVFVGSGDLSHCQKEDGPYGFKPEGPRYDERIMDVMGRGAFGELLEFDGNFLEKAEECGHRSFCIMAGAFDRTELSVRKLSHEATFGVGYGFCMYHPEGEAPERDFLRQYEEKEAKRLAEAREKEDAYVRLARRTVEKWVRNREIEKLPGEDEVPREMLEGRAGTFVSIHKNGSLRGCIGTIAPTRDSIAAEIIGNAISASTRDPRFNPIRKEELAELEITVDVLGETERISGPEMLDVKRYGVIVTRGDRRGLLLPNLEGVDTVEDQIAISRQKAGIGPDEPVELERFEVVRHY